MKLHEQVKHLDNALEIAVNGIEEIRHYLNLAKFREDIMVNKNDILLRLNELDNALYTESIKLN